MQKSTCNLYIIWIKIRKLTHLLIYYNTESLLSGRKILSILPTSIVLLLHIAGITNAFHSNVTFDRWLTPMNFVHL